MSICKRCLGIISYILSHQLQKSLVAAVGLMEVLQESAEEELLSIADTRTNEK